MRKRLSVLLAGVLLLLGSLAATTGVAAAQEPYNTKILNASDWLGGSGVDVYSNGSSSYDSHDTGGPAVGLKWQCVELAQRLYTVRGWHNGIFPNVGVAADIWGQAGNLGMTTQANGSISSIVPGDMIIHGYGFFSGAGHVAVVDSVVGSMVYVVEQNFNTTGRATYALSSGSLSRSGTSDIKGIVHDPDNTTTSSGGGAADLVIYRPDGAGTGYWYARNASTGQQIASAWGVAHGGWAQDIPLTGDFNGDGYDDFGIYRDGYWYVRSGVNTGTLLVNGTTHGGWSGDIPFTGDFDGDGKADFGLYRMVSGGGTWYVKSSATGNPTAIWGAVHGSPGDVPVVGDFDGDGYADFGIYRVTNGTGYWYMKSSANGQPIASAWGVAHGGWAQDKPVVGDFNDDGYADFGIYRPDGGTGYWYVRSGVNTGTMLVNGATQGGWTQDIPLAGNFG